MSLRWLIMLATKDGEGVGQLWWGNENPGEWGKYLNSM